MALRSCAGQNFCGNPLADPTREQNGLAGTKSLARRSDAGSNEASIPLAALTLPLVPFAKDFFTKFIKTFVELTQAQDQDQAKP